MARAESAYQSETERRVAAAGDGMVLFVNQALWETLLLQGEHEGCGPGQILNNAVRAYLEQHGSEEAVAYLHAIAGQPVAPGAGR